MARVFASLRRQAFLDGFVSVFDIAGAVRRRPVATSAFDLTGSDLDRIGGDFRAIGDDMRRAMDRAARMTTKRAERGAA